MLIRLLNIMVCISLVGVTVAPASMRPCCCKTMGKTAVAQKAPQSCCAMKATARNLCHPAARSCCSDHNVTKAKSCCSGNELMQERRTCRCLEQMQLVALSGYAVDDGSVRVPCTACGQAPMVQTTQPQVRVSVVDRIAPPGGDALLQTCSLRC